MSAVPVIHVEQARAEAAWEAHQALLKAEAANPKLRGNPVWRCIRMDTYEEFCLAFVKAD